MSTREWPPSVPSLSMQPPGSPAESPSRVALLWLLAVVCYGVGDVATTVVGIHTPGVVETNPVARWAFGHSVVGGMVALKGLAFGGAYLLWRAAPPPHRVGVPLGLVLAGVGVTCWNLSVLASSW